MECIGISSLDQSIRVKKTETEAVVDPVAGGVLFPARVVFEGMVGRGPGYQVLDIPPRELRAAGRGREGILV